MTVRRRTLFSSHFSFHSADSAITERWKTASDPERPGTRQPPSPAGRAQGSGPALNRGGRQSQRGCEASPGGSRQKRAFPGKGNTRTRGHQAQTCLIFCNLPLIFGHFYFIKIIHFCLLVIHTLQSDLNLKNIL